MRDEPFLFSGKYLEDLMAIQAGNIILGPPWYRKLMKGNDTCRESGCGYRPNMYFVSITNGTKQFFLTEFRPPPYLIGTISHQFVKKGNKLRVKGYCRTHGEARRAG